MSAAVLVPPSHDAQVEPHSADAGFSPPSTGATVEDVRPVVNHWYSGLSPHEPWRSCYLNDDHPSLLTTTSSFSIFFVHLLKRAWQKPSSARHAEVTSTSPCFENSSVYAMGPMKTCGSGTRVSTDVGIAEDDCMRALRDVHGVAPPPNR
jgi:hypothetical protein